MTVLVGVRLTTEDKARGQALADLEGITLPALIRRELHRQLDRQSVVDPAWVPSPA